MSKCLFIVTMICFYALLGSAQQRSDFFSINDFRMSSLIIFSNDNQESRVIDDYGGLIVQVNSTFNQCYLFQGQEYDSDLGLYFFPSRIYSSESVRFFQPDPKSQYFSPYLFVGADPINTVDRDGNEGKPLILYHEDHLHNGILMDAAEDLKSATPDAYHYPLSKFTNGELGKLEDWNGRVMIWSHNGVMEGFEFSQERAASREMLKANPKYALISDDVVGGGWQSTVSAKRMGRLLRKYSDLYGKDVKSVMVTGCQGGIAAKRMKESFVNSGGPNQGRRVDFMGPKEGNMTVMAGSKLSTHYDGVDYPLHETRFYLEDADKKYSPIFKTNHEGKKVFHDIGLMDEGGAHYTPADYANRYQIPYMANGRIPAQMESNFEHVIAEY